MKGEKLVLQGEDDEWWIMLGIRGSEGDWKKKKIREINQGESRMGGGGWKMMKIPKWISGKLWRSQGHGVAHICKTVVVRQELLKLNCWEYVVKALMYVVELAWQQLAWVA